LRETARAAPRRRADAGASRARGMKPAAASRARGMKTHRRDAGAGRHIRALRPSHRPAGAL
jgi:hypothetical protein